MDFLKNLLGKVAPFLNAFAGIAMFIPGLQWVSIAAMVANVAQGLLQKPPNWSGILTNLVANALPMGLGKALSAFKGGTAAEFANIFSGKMSGVLGEVAQKVGNPQFSQMITNMQAKLTTPGFQEQFASMVNRATGTAADAQLSSAQIHSALTRGPLGMDTLGLMTPIANQIAQPLMQGNSSYVDPAQAPVVIPPTISGTPVASTAPSIRPSGPING